MTRIGELLAHEQTLSFEFFPPKTDKGHARLRRTLDELEPFDPAYVSVTYGAAGSTRQRTRATVLEIHERTSVTPMPHLTCLAHRREELVDLLSDYRDAGLQNLLALHGDPPRDNPDVERGDLRCARELVELAREVGDFSVGVATHPEGHPNAPDLASDRRHQAEKLAEADFGITQFFFRVEDYLRLVDDLTALGVETPVIAGVIPITDSSQVQRFAALSGAELPVDLAERLDRADGLEEVRRIGVDVGTELCAALLDKGAPGIHFYTLNRAEATQEICRNLQRSTGWPSPADAA
jgi:methylenetetrahydrofolate reductase (NADPH)